MKTHNPRISCIMPAYNAAKFIRVAIDSILAQTYRDFELIVINDGSTDETEQIILSYDDPRIVYIKNDTNLKLIKTLNKGIDAAKGDFISRMDADDEALPELFERELNEFQMHPEAGIVNTLTYHMSEDGRNIRKNRRIIYLSSKSMPIICPLKNMISHPGVMVRAELMKKYKYRDVAQVLHLEDMDLWCRMFADGVVCRTMKKRLLKYRESSGSINALWGGERQHRQDLLTASYVKALYGYDEEIKVEGESISVKKKVRTCLLFFVYLMKNNKVSLLTFGELLRWLLNDLCGDVKKIVIKK